MDKDGSIGSQDDTEKIEDETKTKEEAIKQGMVRASQNTSVQSQEEMVTHFTPTDRSFFQTSEHRRYAGTSIEIESEKDRGQYLLLETTIIDNSRSRK